MWNCKVVVPFGTPDNENTGELNPHHRKLIENADAFAVPIKKNAVAQSPKRKRMFAPKKVTTIKWQSLSYCRSVLSAIPSNRPPLPHRTQGMRPKFVTTKQEY